MVRVKDQTEASIIVNGADALARMNDGHAHWTERVERMGDEIRGTSYRCNGREIIYHGIYNGEAGVWRPA